MEDHPKDNLEKWAILTLKVEPARSWIAQNFNILQSHRATDTYVIAPLFDPVDPFMVQIMTQGAQLKGARIHGYIDLRSVIEQAHAEVVRDDLIKTTETRLFNRPSYYPHPLPGEKLNEIDLRGSGEQVDAFPDPRGYDLYGLPDEPIPLASEEWLRLRSGPGFWARCRAAERELRYRSLHHVSAVERLQRSTNSGSVIPDGVPDGRALQGSFSMPPGMGKAQPASKAADDAKRSNRRRPRSLFPSKPLGWLD